MIKKRFCLFTTVIVLFLISGCTVGPDYQKPDVNMPEAWEASKKSGMSCDTENISHWWQQFNDRKLNKLIQKAVKENLDIQEAYWRIAESRAARDFSIGEYYPSVDNIGSYTRSRQSENLSDFQFPFTSSDQTNIHSAGFDSGWEIDLFGRIKRSVESSEAFLESSIENFRDVRVTLISEIARNYFELRTTQERIRYAVENVKAQNKTLQLTRDRFEADLAPELDVRQAELNLANTKSEIPSLRIAEKEAINRIAVLVGKMPGALNEDLTEYKKLPGLDGKISAGLPVDLLRRRPDIRSAERQLAAQTALIGAQKAEMYPQFSLFGTFQLKAEELSDMDQISSRDYSFGPQFRWRIFDGDRLKNLVKIEKAQTKQLLKNYKKTVLQAVEEVENSMVAYKQETIRKQSLKRSVKATERSVELVQTLYKNGLTDFQNVLDMQRTLFNQQDQLVVSKGLLIQDLVRLYKSLGGGWDMQETRSAKNKTFSKNKTSK